VIGSLRTLVAAESIVLALLLVVGGCGGGKLSKEQYKLRVCDIMIDAEDAESQADPQQALGEAADELSFISVPPEVADLHNTLVTEYEKFSETPKSEIDTWSKHLAAGTKAFSEIRAKGYDVKPGWGTCGTG
jgi:hypothetical protein